LTWKLLPQRVKNDAPHSNYSAETKRNFTPEHINPQILSGKIPLYGRTIELFRSLGTTRLTASEEFTFSASAGRAGQTLISLISLSAPIALLSSCYR